MNGERIIRIKLNWCKRRVESDLILLWGQEETIKLLLPTLTVYGVVRGWTPFQINRCGVQQSRLDVFRRWTGHWKVDEEEEEEDE